MKRLFVTMISCISILILLINPVSDFLNKSLIKPIFSKIESNLWTDLSVLILVGLGVWNLSTKRDHRFFSLIAGIVIVFLAIFRLSGMWAYTPTYLVPVISYVDLIGAALLGIAGWHLAKLCKRDTTTSVKPKDILEFIEDNTIDDVESDTYERNVVATRIGEIILNTENKKSFAIGITGKYGSGKTSFLNLILKSWGDKKDEAPSIVHFNPWDSKCTEDIQRFFFDVLVAHLSNEDKRLSSSMHHYFRKLSNRESWLSRATNDLRDIFLFNDQDYYSDKKEVAKMMANFKRKVLVVIDDLDRLHAEEVIEVLRIIRNTANFPNMLYLVAYDKEFVEQAVAKLNVRVDGRYLDKIFQLEIPMPKFEHRLIGDSLLSKLKDTVSEDDLRILEKDVMALHFHSDFSEAVGPSFRNHRDVVRFINNFKITYSLTAGEVNIIDLFFLEILKVRYPLAYDTLYESKDEILVSESYSGLFIQRHLLRKIDNSDDVYVVMTLLKKSYGKNDLEMIKRIFRQLFDTSTFEFRRNRQQSISSLEYFETYFATRLSKSGFSEQEFRMIYLNDNADRKEYIERKISQGNYLKLIHRILNIELPEFKNRIHYERIMRDLTISIGQKYLMEKETMTFPFDKFITRHIISSDKIIRRFYDVEEEAYTRFLNNIFKNQVMGAFFHSELTHRIIMMYGDSYFISMQQLVEYQTSYFREYVDSGHRLSRKVMGLFWRIREYESKNLNPMTKKPINADNWQLNKVAISILERHLHTTDITYFLESLIRRDESTLTDYRLENKLIPMLFVERDELINFIQNHPHTSNDVTEEFLSFVTKLHKNEAVEYKFEHLFKDDEDGD